MKYYIKTDESDTIFECSGPFDTLQDVYEFIENDLIRFQDTIKNGDFGNEEFEEEMYYEILKIESIEVNKFKVKTKLTLSVDVEHLK